MIIFLASVLIIYNSSSNSLSYSKLRLLHPPPRLIEPNLRPRNQTLLQRTPNLDRLHGPRQLHRQPPIIQTGGRELISFRHESLLEPPVIRPRDLPPDPGRFVDGHEVRRRVQVDGQFALRADDLGRVFLARGHHARRVQVGDAAAVELDDADRVVAVVVPAEVGLHGGDAAGDDGLDRRVLAEEPEGEVDVVDGAVDEDAAGELGVGDEEAARVEFVARLAADD